MNELKETLDKQTIIMLEKILAKCDGDITREDISTLQARSAYLTEAEKDRFNAIRFEDVPNEGKLEKPRRLSQMNLDELTYRANELGLVVEEGQTRKQLIAKIEEEINK